MPLPAPPPGCSPTLGARRSAEPRERIPVLAIAFAAFAGVALWEYGRGDLAWPWAAGIFGAAFASVAWAVLRGEVSSGADWLRRTAALGSAWVRTDRLIEVAVEPTVTGSRVLLVDAEGRRLFARLEELAETPSVWRPFYGALSASLASGRLRADPETRRALGLPGA